MKVNVSRTEVQVVVEGVKKNIYQNHCFYKWWKICKITLSCDLLLHQYLTWDIQNGFYGMIWEYSVNFSIQIAVNTDLRVWLGGLICALIFWGVPKVVLALMIWLCAFMLSVQEAEYTGFAKLVGCMRTEKTVRHMIEQINAEKMTFPDYDKRSNGKEISSHTSI